MSISDQTFRDAFVSRRTFLQRAGVAGAGALLAGHGALASAAPGAPGDRQRAAAQDQPERKEGGTAIFTVGQEGSHLVPPFSSFSTVITPTVPFFSGLTRPGPELEPEPDLAESWEANADGTLYTFKLRQGVTFHDGQPFTAKDVKFTWELIAHPENVTAAQLYSFFSKITGAEAYHAGEAEEITGIKVVDDYTVEVTLDSPWAPFLTIGANQYIVPQHILGEVEVGKILEHEYARAPIGTGPFKFVAWQAGDSIIGEKFDEYYAGRPALDQVVLRVAVLDDNTKITALRSGELNATTLTLVGLDSLGDDPSVHIVQAPGRANQYLEFNLAKPIFADVKVRKALSYGVNRQAIVDAVYQGRAKIYNSVFPYDWWATKQDTTLFDNDPEQAKKLLDEAGWVVGDDDGIREKDGEKFSFTLIALDNGWPIVLQQQWKEIGVDMKIETVDFPTLSTQFYTTHIFDAVGMNVPYSLYTDPHYSLPGYFLSANNRNAYKNPKSDELIIAAASTNDQEERKKLYYDWQEVIAQDVPHLWIANPDEVSAYSAGLWVPERGSNYLTWREVKDWFWTEG
ncbi:MAG TPA: ABC transporter substrate-binding protein [Thermomicrobiales bacterium]|nr:ABC transporter substrate-binding protein [Thermomicrobiales bacterium]